MAGVSHIVQKLRVVSPVHPCAGRERGDGEGGEHKMGRNGWHGAIQHHFAEVCDVPVDRVAGKHKLQPGRHVVNGVENRRTVHQEPHEHFPEVIDVAEEYEQGRKNHPDAEIEDGQRDDRIQQTQELPRERHLVQRTKDEKHKKRQDEVEKHLHVGRENEKILRDVHLREDAGVPEQTAHPGACGPGKPVERQQPAEEIRGVVRRLAAEELPEHDLHDKQHEKRRKHAPPHAKNRTLVLLLEVALDQLLEQELMLP